MEKKKCTICRIVLICCLMLFCAVSVKAESDGKVSLQLSRPDVAMSLYQVAEAKEDGLYYTEAFADCNVKLETVSQAEAQEAADALASYVKAQKLKGRVRKTDQNGMLSFTELEDGVYLLIQDEGQDTLIVQNMLFLVPQKINNEENYNVVLEAKASFPGGAVLLNKTDADGKALAEAVFTLQVLDNSNWKELKTSLITDKNGQIVITDLPIGSYRFVETKAPTGFQLLKEPVPFEIQSAGQVALTNGIYHKASGEVTELYVVNEREDTNTSENSTPGNSNPGYGTPNVKTGDDSPISLFVALLLLAWAVMLVSVKIRKKHNN